MQLRQNLRFDATLCAVAFYERNDIGLEFLVFVRDGILANNLGGQTFKRKDGTGKCINVRVGDFIPVQKHFPGLEEIQRCDANFVALIQVCTDIQQQFGGLRNVRKVLANTQVVKRCVPISVLSVRVCLAVCE